MARSCVGRGRSEEWYVQFEGFYKLSKFDGAQCICKAGKESRWKKVGNKIGYNGNLVGDETFGIATLIGMDDVMEDLPPDMQNMKNLHSFDLQGYGGISLPNCICDFERLEVLSLISCYQLQELPPLERLPVLRVLTLQGVK
jgi:hypothetical protein